MGMVMTAVSAETAADLLCRRFAMPNSSGIMELATAISSPSDVDARFPCGNSLLRDADHVAGLLASIPDRAAPLPQRQLHGDSFPRVLAARVLEHLIAASKRTATDCDDLSAVQCGAGGSDERNGLGHTVPAPPTYDPEAHLCFAATVYEKLINRGWAQATLQVLVAHATEAGSGTAPSAVQGLILRVCENTAAAERLTQVLLSQAVTDTIPSLDHAVHLLQSLLGPQALSLDSALKYLLCSKWLLRKTLPTKSAAALLCFLDSPCLPADEPTNRDVDRRGSHAHASTSSGPSDRTATAVDRTKAHGNDFEISANSISKSSASGSGLLADVSLSLAIVWSDAESIHGLSVPHQAYMTQLLQLCVEMLPDDYWSAGAPPVLPHILDGVSNRLQSALPATRMQAMRVGRVSLRRPWRCI